jgi:hypothetical protein
MPDDNTAPARQVTALELWQLLAQALAERHVPQLVIGELIDRHYPGLWLAAHMEHARQCCQALSGTR